MSPDSGVGLCGVNLSLLSYGSVQVCHSVDKRLSTPWRGFQFGPSVVLSARAPVLAHLPCGKRFHRELCTHLFKKDVPIAQDQARGPTKGASHGASKPVSLLDILSRAGSPMQTQSFLALERQNQNVCCTQSPCPQGLCSTHPEIFQKIAHHGSSLWGFKATQD